MNNTYIDELKNILDKNVDKRVCVVGTSCTGKSTYLNETNNGLDMDKIIFPLLNEKEKEQKVEKLILMTQKICKKESKKI